MGGGRVKWEKMEENELKYVCMCVCVREKERNLQLNPSPWEAGEVQDELLHLLNTEMFS